MGEGAFRLAELEGRQAVAVEGDVDVRRVGVESLAHHEARLAVLVNAGAEEGDVGGDGDVAGHLLPDEVEGIGGRPHVFSAACDGENLVGGVVGGGAGMEDAADVDVPFKGAEFCGGVGGEDCERKDEDRQECFKHLWSPVSDGHQDNP